MTLPQTRRLSRAFGCTPVAFDACSGLLRAVLISLLVTGTQPVWSFTLEDVAQRARELAGSSYAAPPAIPGFMQDLAYHDYQGMRFRPEQSLWRDAGYAFQVMLVPAGLYYRHAVTLHVVDEQGVHDVVFEKSRFSYASAELERRVPADLGYAGFKLTYPFQPGVQNQFLVFAGASYFRAVARHNNFGISARGLAVDTALPTGEEFPAFTEFWLQRPAPGDTAVTVYGLLDSKSMTGAYQFVITPGDKTTVQVQSRLYLRSDVALLGLAPLTSMFYYGENTPKPQGEWRGEVHDSDGLLIHDCDSGEWLWRPLINPQALAVDYFSTTRLCGFGLLQRDSRFANYQDLEARYDTRPSAWVTPDVEPDGDPAGWRDGQVVLVQLPTPDETNDNIVAFWRPAPKAVAGDALSYAYTVTVGDAAIAQMPVAHTAASFLGDGARIGGGREKGALRVLVDFAGGELDSLPADASVVGVATALEGGEIIEQFVEYVAPLKHWRLSILARPAPGKDLALRAYLHRDSAPLTETWTYRLPADQANLAEAQ